jgi:hypothetical protein
VGDLWNTIKGFSPAGILTSVLPYGIALLIGVFGYNIVYDKGYNAAKAECNAGAIQSKLDAKTIEINNLTKQISDQQPAIQTADTKKQIVIQKVIEAKRVVEHEVQEAPSCDVDATVIGVLNRARATTSNSN